MNKAMLSIFGMLLQLQQAIQASLEDSHHPTGSYPSPAVAIHPDALAFSPRPEALTPETFDLPSQRRGRSVDPGESVLLHQVTLLYQDVHLCHLPYSFERMGSYPGN